MPFLGIRPPLRRAGRAGGEEGAWVLDSLEGFPMNFVLQEARRGFHLVVMESAQLLGNVILCPKPGAVWSQQGTQL